MNYLIEDFKKTNYYDLYISLVNTMNESYYLKDKSYGVNYTKRVLFTSLINSYLNDVDLKLGYILGNAIIYHDIGRKKLGQDSEHGKLSAERLKELREYEDFKQIFTEEELRIIEFLIIYHCVDYDTINVDINTYEFNDTDEVLKLLTIIKDSVSLEFLRFGDDKFDTNQLKFKTTVALIETEKELLEDKSIYDINLKFELIKGNYDKYYSDDKFKKIIEKLLKTGKGLVTIIVYPAMLLFNTLKDSEEISVQDKIFIIASLGYLIYPIDLIPDNLPGGYTDDAISLIFAIINVAKHITPEIRDNTKKWLRSKFKDFDDNNFEFIDSIIDKGMSFGEAMSKFINFKKIFEKVRKK